jgi:hypothetical protein
MLHRNGQVDRIAGYAATHDALGHETAAGYYDWSLGYELLAIARRCQTRACPCVPYDNETPGLSVCPGRSKTHRLQYPGQGFFSYRLVLVTAH